MQIVEHSSDLYKPRTLHNAQSADLTVAFAIDFTTAGERLTKKAANWRYVAISLNMESIEAARILYKACRHFNVSTLNVAGNGIYSLAEFGWTQESLNQWIFDVIALVHKHRPFDKIISGGQTGVDLAGGVAAESLSVTCVMTLPKGLIQRDINSKTITQTQKELMDKVNYYVNLIKKD